MFFFNQALLARKVGTGSCRPPRRKPGRASCSRRQACFDGQGSPCPDAYATYVRLETEYNLAQGGRIGQHGIQHDDKMGVRIKMLGVTIRPLLPGQYDIFIHAHQIYYLIQHRLFA